MDITVASKPRRSHAMEGAFMHASPVTTSLRTSRLLLRRWRAEDRSAFAVLNESPEVMRHMPRPLTRDESHQWAETIEQELQRDGFGLWALELPGEVPFIGFAGLDRIPFAADFTPAVEIGWRLFPQFWGHGFATEAAKEALRAGFEQFGLEEAVANTFVGNAPSRRVMDRLRMVHDPAEDFDHPQIDGDNPRRRYVLYRLPRARWLSAQVI